MKDSRNILGSGVSLLVFASIVMASSEPVSLTQQEQSALETITNGANKFATKLYLELVKNTTGNVFVSPLSAQMVLAEAFTGAKGSTAEEIKQLLSLPDSVENTLVGHNSILRVLKDPLLNLANCMFVEATAPVKKDFQDNAEKYFLSSAKSVNFIKDSEKSRMTINSWVEDQTNKKITNLIAEGSLSSATRLVLVNAIHFKANWKLKFDSEKTKEEPFHVSKTQTVPVQMMHIKKKFGFKHDKDLKAKFLELDYEGRRFRMVIILPDEVDGLAELEAKLASVDLSEKLKYFDQPTVTVALPKFKLEETMDLNEILKSMGVTSMFNEKSADFSGMSDQPLVVSKVVQKAFVDVNEMGTEAAASTADVVADCISFEFLKNQDQEFLADHPFLFLILLGKFYLFLGHFDQQQLKA